MSKKKIKRGEDFRDTLVVGAVEVKLLKFLCEKGRSIGVEMVGLAKKKSLYTLLGRMVQKGWVTKDEEKRYTVTWLGVRALEAWRVYHG